MPYSNLNASIGSVAAAFVAGYQPKKMITAEQLKATSDAPADVAVDHPNSRVTPSDST